MSFAWLAEVQPGGYWKQPASTRFTLLVAVIALGVAYLAYESSRRSR